MPAVQSLTAGDFIRHQHLLQFALRLKHSQPPVLLPFVAGEFVRLFGLGARVNEMRLGVSYPFGFGKTHIFGGAGAYGIIFSVHVLLSIVTISPPIPGGVRLPV